MTGFGKTRHSLHAQLTTTISLKLSPPQIDEKTAPNLVEHVSSRNIKQTLGRAAFAWEWLGLSLPS